MAGKRRMSSRQQKQSAYLRKDVEDTKHPQDRKYRFRDEANLDPDDQRRVQFKPKLLESVESSKYLEEFRKSDSQFYQQQNEKLDDWLEVNAIVEALADDILESFDPRDVNGDGIAEGGALQDTAGCVEPFLPEEEQKKRRVGRRNAKWAININVIANIFLLIFKAVAAFYSSSLSLIASIADSALDLLCTAIVFTTHKLVRWNLNWPRRKFPLGRRQLEPVGILVFSIIMIITFIQFLRNLLRN